VKPQSLGPAASRSLAICRWRALCRWSPPVLCHNCGDGVDGGDGTVRHDDLSSGCRGWLERRTPARFSARGRIRGLPGFVSASGPLRRLEGPPPLLPTFAVRDSRNHPGPPRLRSINLSGMLCTTPADPIGARRLCYGALLRQAVPHRFCLPRSCGGWRRHCRFRGLLELYTRYGLPDCSPLCVGFVAGFRSARLPAVTARELSNLTINCSSGCFPHW
jgi:hypothetical protein